MLYYCARIQRICIFEIVSIIFEDFVIQKSIMYTLNCILLFDFWVYFVFMTLKCLGNLMISQIGFTETLPKVNKLFLSITFLINGNFSGMSCRIRMANIWKSLSVYNTFYNVLLCYFTSEYLFGRYFVCVFRMFMFYALTDGFHVVPFFQITVYFVVIGMICMTLIYPLKFSVRKNTNATSTWGPINFTGPISFLWDRQYSLIADKLIFSTPYTFRNK